LGILTKNLLNKNPLNNLVLIGPCRDISLPALLHFQADKLLKDANLDVCLSTSLRRAGAFDLHYLSLLC
jgi:hypothetical protein